MAVAALLLVALLHAECRKRIPELVLRLAAVLNFERCRDPQNVPLGQIVALFLEVGSALPRTLKLEEMQKAAVPLFRRGLRDGVPRFCLRFARLSCGLSLRFLCRRLRLLFGNVPGCVIRARSRLRRRCLFFLRQRHLRKPRRKL